MFKASIALAVAAIPEGLPAAVTVTLAIGVNRMAKRRAIIRKLPAVETLGSTMVICTDKTGTLTQNEMTVQRLVAGGDESRVSGVGYGPAGEIVPGPSSAAREVLLAGLLCNDTALTETDGHYEVAGDPTEAALLTSAAKAGLDRAAQQEALPRLDAIPFESAYQYMATLHDAGDGRRVVYLKGAVEKVLERCTAAVDPAGEPAALDAAAVARRRGRAGRRRPARPRLRPRRAARRHRPHRPRGRRRRPHVPRPAGDDGPAASGGHRRRQGVPPRRHQREDDHRRPRRHGGRDRPRDRHRRPRRCRRHRRRDGGAPRPGVHRGRGRDQRLRPRHAGAEAAPGRGAAVQGPGRRHDRRRRQRRPGAQAGRHRRRHGHHRHRRGQGRRGHGAHRRRLRLHRGRRRGGPRRLRQPRQVHRLRAADQRRPGARAPGRASCSARRCPSSRCRSSGST